MDLTDFLNWNVLAMKWENGEKIEKQEVIRELNNGQVPTDRALPMLADMLTDSGKFINGRKKCLYDTVGKSMQPSIVFLVLRYEKVFKWKEKRNPIIKEKRKMKKDGLTPRNEAKKLVANMFNISVRKVEEYIGIHENWVSQNWMK